MAINREYISGAQFIIETHSTTGIIRIFASLILGKGQFWLKLPIVTGIMTPVDACDGPASIATAIHATVARARISDHLGSLGKKLRCDVFPLRQHTE
jgi:hypothetical protein